MKPSLSAQDDKDSTRGWTFVIGIGGPTAAGKTSLAKSLAEKYKGAGVCLIKQDSYYLDRSYLDKKRREFLNYDEPSAIDHDLIRRHLESLMIGQTVKMPTYDFHTHTRTRRFQLLRPESLMILEGIHSLWDSRVRSLMNLKVYVDAEPDVRLIRRLQRDTLERGRSTESIIAQYVESVRPMQKQFIEPCKDYADLVVDTSDSFSNAAEELIGAVAERLHASIPLKKAMVA